MVGQFLVKHSTFFVGLAITLTVVVGEAATSFNPQGLADVRMWLIGVATASVRQAAVYILREIALRRPTVTE